MIDVGIALAFHILGVVWWIGGLAFVTCVLLPILRSGKMGNIQDGFHFIENRFAPQVKVAVIVVGITGLYMLYRFNAWSWLTNPHTWWIPAMLLYWAWFVLMLFVLGPAGLLKKIMKGSGGQEEKAWQRLHRVHGVLLVIGLIIIFGVLSGRYGLFA